MSQGFMTVPVELLNLLVKHAEANNNAMTCAARLADILEEQEKTASKKLPSLVASLRDAGLIEAHEIKEAHAALSDFGRTLQVLANTVEEYRKLQAKGAAEWPQTASQEKAASDAGYAKRAVSGWKANVAGYRYGQDEVSESDRIFLRLIGRD